MVRKIIAAADNRFLEIGNEVAACWLKGMTYREIGKKHSITYEQTRQIMRRARQLWRKKNERKITAKVDEELRRLDVIETEAWAAWERSQQDEVIRIKSKEKAKDGPTEKRQVKRRANAGDPRFLTVALDCVAKRCAIMGIDKAQEETRHQTQFGILVVVENADQADKILTYTEFERARALAGNYVEAVDVAVVPDEAEGEKT